VRGLRGQAVHWTCAAWRRHLQHGWQCERRGLEQSRLPGWLVSRGAREKASRHYSVCVGVAFPDSGAVVNVDEEATSPSTILAATLPSGRTTRWS
jgi:hypothetical protein